MANNQRNNQIPSAYDDFLNSPAFEDTEADIAYFSKSSQPDKKPREAHSASRSSLAPEKAKAKKKRVHARAQKPAPAQKSVPKKAKDEPFHLLLASFLVCFILLFAGIFTLASGDKQYSENENRYLAQRPEWSAASVADGRYMKQTESYLCDQFFARSTLVKLHTAIDVFFGKKEINNVYIGKKHFLFEKPEAYHEQQMQQTIKKINAFTDKHKKISSYCAIAPNATQLLSQYMPLNAPNTNQSEQIKTIYHRLDKRIKCIDICSNLQQSDNKEQLYYRTDHHWTTTAAEIAFKQIAANMKLDTSKVPYQSYVVTTDFQGTLAASSGLFRAKDTISITAPQTDIKYVVNHVAENTKSASMFDSEKLSQSNQYEVFFGGNFAQIRIDTTLDSDKVLLVFKDSYANCLVPMLMPYYKSIIMIDPRYYHDNIEQLLKKEAVTDILWLYSANTLLADTSIASML